MPQYSIEVRGELSISRAKYMEELSNVELSEPRLIALRDSPDRPWRGPGGSFLALTAFVLEGRPRGELGGTSAIAVVMRTRRI